MPTANIDVIRAALSSELDENRRCSLFVILDAARDERIYSRILDATPDRRCLHARGIPRIPEAALPHLLELDLNSELVTWILGEGWGHSWGVFVLSLQSLADLEDHFRRLLKVRDEKGKALFFRFYDPRVLRGYIPTCTTAEVRLLFGPVSSFFMETEAAIEDVGKPGAFYCADLGALLSPDADSDPADEASVDGETETEAEAEAGAY